MIGALKKHLGSILSRKHLLLVLCLAFLVYLAPSQTQAQGGVVGTVFGGVVSWVLGWIVFVINYVIAMIFGVGIAIISYFISVILQLNTNIVNSLIVRNGFQITLALANLGFVLAIIVIAIMTILRYETYALKSTLWKLVAAAILVNFSLVIGAAILNFSDTLTLYFLSSINPGTSGSSFLNFASAIAGAFEPQRMFLNGSAQISTAGGTIQAANIDAFQGAGQGFGSIITVLLNLFFPTLFLIITVIALAGLFIMLLIRYLYLAILLILMPLAWLMWIFPATTRHWTDWWDKFIRWTMFAPIVVFFLYLAILTGSGANAQQSTGNTYFIQGISFESSSNNPIVAAISNVTGNMLSTALGSLLQMAMMIAMVFAGLFFAQSMGIKFADATLKGATAVTSKFGGFVKNRGVMGAGWAMRKTPLPRLAEKMQRGVGAKPAGFLQRAYKYTGAEFAVQKLGQGVEAIHATTREGLVKEAEKRMSGYTTDQLVHGLPSFTSPEKIYAMNKLGEKGILDAVSMDNTHREETKKLFAEYGQANEYEKNVEKKSGVSSEMYEASKRGAKPEEIDALAVEFAKKFSRAEVSAMQAADLFSNVPAGKKKFGMENEALREISSATAYGFAVAAPQFSSTVLSKLKGASLENFASDYRTGLGRAVRMGDLNIKEGGERLKKFEQSILNNTMGFVPVETVAAPGIAPAAPTPPPAS